MVLEGGIQSSTQVLSFDDYKPPKQANRVTNSAWGGGWQTEAKIERVCMGGSSGGRISSERHRRCIPSDQSVFRLRFWKHRSQLRRGPEVSIWEVRTAMVLGLLSAVQSTNVISRQQSFHCLLHSSCQSAFGMTR
jgi:hypothetical protein